jgi:glycosyltransferase involved in cell wall biosynthesis
LLASLSEGLSNALLEYAIAGLPVIATDVGGNPEVLDSGNCGILVPSNDPTALSRAMNELISDPELRKELGLKICNYANTNFIDSSIIEGFRGIYNL